MLANIGNIRVSQSARLSLNGQVTPTHAVMYSIGDQGPFTDNFSDSNYSPENVMIAMAGRMVKLYQLGVVLPYPPQPVPGQANTWNIPILPNPGNVAAGGAALAPIGSFQYTAPAP